MLTKWKTFSPDVFLNLVCAIQKYFSEMHLGELVMHQVLSTTYYALVNDHYKQETFRNIYNACFNVQYIFSQLQTESSHKTDYRMYSYNLNSGTLHNYYKQYCISGVNRKILK